MSAKLQRFITNHILALLDQAANLTTARSLLPVINRSLATGQPFRGVNQFITGLASAIRDYPSPNWLTLRQVIERGGRVRRADFCRYSPLVLWRRISWAKSGEQRACLLPAKFIKIWNVDQTTLDPPAVISKDTCHFPLRILQRILAGLPESPKIQRGAEGALYRPGTDVIYLPDSGKFPSPESEAGTTLHELAHWTGHSSRLNRRTMREEHAFGSQEYAEEELTVELAVSWMMARLAIQPAPTRSSVEYLQSWSGMLAADTRAVFRLAGQAQKIMDFLLGADGTPAVDVESNAEDESGKQ